MLLRHEILEASAAKELYDSNLVISSCFFFFIDSSIAGGAVNCVNMLLQRGVSPDCALWCPCSPIVEACSIAGQKGNVILKTLLAKGAVIDVPDNRGLRLLTA